MQHQNNKSAVFMNVIKCLRNLFVWPENGQNISKKNWWKLVTILIISFVPISLGLAGHIYVSLKGLFIADLVNDIVYILLFSIYVSSSVFYFLCTKKLCDIINNINNPKYGKPDNFNRLAKRIEFLTTFIHHYVFSIASSYVLFFLFSDANCKLKKMGDSADIIGYVCGVPIPAWFPMNLDIFPWKYFLIFCNAFILMYILPNGASASILYYGFIVFSVEKIDHLIFFLKKINPQAEKKGIREQMILCIKYYTDITMLVDDINDSIGYIFAPSQNGLIGLMIAVLEYQALLDKSAIAFFALSIWLLIQAVACYCGQSLENASLRLSNEVYDMPWYFMEISLQREFKIFHAQVQRNLHLKVKPAIHMNMEYYCQVMNGSYSFLMFLTNLE